MGDNTKGGNTMAVTANPSPTRLAMRMNYGTDPESGNMIVRTITLTSLRTTATLENLYATAVDLATLLEKPLYAVEKIDQAQLVES
jgi:hypothetical protein